MASCTCCFLKKFFPQADTEGDAGVASQSSTMGASQSSCDNLSEDEDDKSLTSNYSTRNRTIWNNRKAEPLIGNNSMSVEYLDLINETSGFFTFDDSVKTRISQVLTSEEEKENLVTHDESHVTEEQNHVTNKKKIIPVESLLSDSMDSKDDDDWENQDDNNKNEENQDFDDKNWENQDDNKKNRENQDFDDKNGEDFHNNTSHNQNSENKTIEVIVNVEGGVDKTENDEKDGDQNVLIEKENTKIVLHGIDNMAADFEEENLVVDETCKSNFTGGEKLDVTENKIDNSTTDIAKQEDVIGDCVGEKDFIVDSTGENNETTVDECKTTSENVDVIDEKCSTTNKNNEIVLGEECLLASENDDATDDKCNTISANDEIVAGEEFHLARVDDDVIDDICNATSQKNDINNDKLGITSENNEMKDDVRDTNLDNFKISNLDNGDNSLESHDNIDNEIPEGNEDSSINQNSFTSESNSLSSGQNFKSLDGKIVVKIEHEHDKSSILDMDENFNSNSKFSKTQLYDNKSTVSETDNEQKSDSIDYLGGLMSVCTCQSENNQKTVCHENCQVVQALFTKDFIKDIHDQNKSDYLNHDYNDHLNHDNSKFDNSDQSSIDYMNLKNHNQCVPDKQSNKLDYLNSGVDSFQSSQSGLSCDNKSDETDNQICDKDDNFNNQDFIDNDFINQNNILCDNHDLNSDHKPNHNHISDDDCDNIDKDGIEKVDNNNQNDMNLDYEIHYDDDKHDYGERHDNDYIHDDISNVDRLSDHDHANQDQSDNQYYHDNHKVNNLVQKSPKKREFPKHENDILYSVKEETDDEIEKELQCSESCSVCSEYSNADLPYQISDSPTNAEFVNSAEIKSCDCADPENCVHYSSSIYQNCVQNGANLINNNISEHFNDSDNLLPKESLLDHVDLDDEKHFSEHDLEKHLSDEEHQIHSDSLLTDDEVYDKKHLSENDQFADDDYLSVEDGAYMTCSDNEQDGHCMTDSFVRHSQPESGFGETTSPDFTLSEKDLKISANEHFESHLSDTEVENYEVPGPEEVFEDADEYYHGNHHENDSADIEWDAGSLCGCPDCLAQLRLERIVTADKCTMCPEEPPYVMMCEICEELLENQLQKTEKDSKKKEGDLKKQLKGLKEENEKQQKIIQQNLQLGPEAKIEATMQHEITRLTSENLDLRESLDKNQDQIRKLKKMLKVYSKRLKDGEAAEIAAEIDKDDTQNVENVASIKHRERNYMGMLEYRKEDEGALIKNLIMDLKPRVAVGLLPGLPAYILFMCVRHTDYVNDDEKVRGLLTNTINGMKKCVKKHHSDIERVMLWLANTCRLLHTLKQYSGEKAFQADNTARQNEHCLRNFDLSEYRQVFSDLAVWIYQTLIKQMQETVQQMIVPAVLEHEAIAGLTASKPSGMRGRSSSTATDLEDKELSLDSLMKVMNKYSQILAQHAVDPELVKQIFRQLYYFVGSGALNNLLLRKDMCNWSKGMQIRYNLSHLEQWLRDNKLQESGALSALEPITQASQLLQARKTDADVDSICEMCSKLTTPQIVKILNLYTPVDEFEERVPISFIRKIQQKLKGREEADNTLLMDTKYSFPVTFPFNPSSIALESIEVPQQLHLGFLNRH